MTSPAAVPRATYRLQLHREFTFQDAARIVPYLAELGISHLYSSPILKARPGSTHGYDVIDHTVLNPELGTPEEFAHLIEVLHAHGMGLVVDIVPNHLGVMGADNVWWLDLLENGPASQYADHFDVDWRPLRASLRNRVLVPILGEPYGSVLERGELQLHFEPASGAFDVRYHEHRLPIDPREYPLIFRGAVSALAPEDPDRADFESLLTSFEHLPARDVQDPELLAIRRRDKEAHKRRLTRLIERAPAILEHISSVVARINGTPGQPESFDALEALLDAQAYRLAYWRVAVDEINYRRFFDVNDLAALRMNAATVFERTHELILQLVARGDIAGLRIDHSDGLFDPQGYFERLQYSVRAALQLDPASDAPLYIVTEKILAAHERLPSAWPVHGTTGYDFAGLLTSWLVHAGSEAAMGRIYRHFTAVTESFDQIGYASRKLVMRIALAAELEVLATQLDRIAQLGRQTADFTRAAMREAIMETIACFPVYRTYITERGVSEEDRRIVTWAINVARRRSVAAELSVFDFLRDVLLGTAAAGRPAAHAAAMLEFAMKFQQVTAPVTAKGVEDTGFYRYYNLVCLNEVGGDPRRWSISSAALHQENLERARHWPHSMLATSTHDTKRSEDVRARIAVLSEMPERWRRHLGRWSRLNRDKRRQLEGSWAPTRNDEYLIYQTLLGMYCPQLDRQQLLARLQAYLVKAAREAKLATAWMNPDAAYEQALGDFSAELLASNAFMHDFSLLAEIVAYFGHLNALAQTVLKLTVPGVPDLYQGMELPQLTLVDPDNRRPVAFAEARQRLVELRDRWHEPRAALLAELLANWRDGTSKLFVTHALLELRRELPQLFAAGDYLPLPVEGEHRDHVVAFQRATPGATVVVVVTRWLARLMRGEIAPPIREVWGDTLIRITAPAGSTGCEDLFSKRRFELETACSDVLVARLLAHFPAAVLVFAG